MSRCVFVFCEALEKEQIDEVLLTGTDYELANVELSDKVLPGRWILPPFLRLKDLHFEAALYAKAVVRKKVVSDSLSLPEPLTCAGVVTSEQTEMKDDTADEDNLLEAPEKTKPPMSPQKRRASKRRSKASSSEVNTKKTKIASTHKTETAMEKVQPAKDKKTEQTPPENASDSEETAGTQDMESPSSSNT